jgi:hypothetical protein
MSVVRTARLTGTFYLALGLTGMLGFLLVRPMLFVPDDAAATLARLIEHQRLARLGIALELGIVLSQTLAALWFFRLFRRVDDFAAGAIAVFGLVNAIVILVSAALLGASLEAALGADRERASHAHLLYAVSNHCWAAGNLFFGLWLIPMGSCVLRSGVMPRLLGHVLIVGGVGYVLNTFLSSLVPGSVLASGLLLIPATVGEFWMIGHLLISRRLPDASS